MQNRVVKAHRKYEEPFQWYKKEKEGKRQKQQRRFETKKVKVFFYIKTKAAWNGCANTQTINTFGWNKNHNTHSQPKNYIHLRMWTRDYK